MCGCLFRSARCSPALTLAPRSYPDHFCLADGCRSTRRAATTILVRGTDELMCSTVVHDVMLGPLPEASGLALSTRSPGMLWSMNDSEFA